MTNAVSEGSIGREGMQNIDDGSEALEQFWITLPEFVKRLGLFLEYIKDGIGTVTAIDLGGERVLAEFCSSLFGVVFQGSIEKGLKIGGGGGGSRIISRRHGIMEGRSDVSGGREGGKGRVVLVNPCLRRLIY